MVTNEQKFKTEGERGKEFLSQREVSSVATVVANEFAHWLALEAEEEPEPCPFCGGTTEVITDGQGYYGVSCIHCDYTSERYEQSIYAIAAHNSVARAVEAAAKQSVTDCNHLGNADKMREALDSIYNKLETLDVEEDSYADEVIASVKSVIVEALYAPPRNCDVGTAEEQAKRMNEFCNLHKHGGSVYACENCELFTVDRCELAWSQMPYEEGGAK